MKTKILRGIRGIRQDTSGSVAIIFGLSALALIVAGGVALDYTRGFTTRTQLQSAADGAVLAAVRAKMDMPTMPLVPMQQVARRYFDSNAAPTDALNIDSFAISNANNDYTLSIGATIKSTLLAVAGYPTIDVGVASTANVGPGRPLEVALVLDNTGSMAGSKIADLKSAANILVDELMDKPRSDVKVAVVPFSSYVNVGLANRTMPWMNVLADYSETTNQCWNTYPDMVKTNCRTETNTCYNDGVPYSCTQQVCDIDYGTPVEQCGPVTSSYTWHGCAGSRATPLNVEDRDYSANPVPGIMNAYCPRPILPLSSRSIDVKAEIDAMGASGETYIPAGLIWGWRTLTNGMPFTQGRPKVDMLSAGGTKAIVLMTDGENTRSVRYNSTSKYLPAGGGDHWGTDVANANQTTKDMCANIDADGIIIYSVAFQVTDTTVKGLLEDCALNTGGKYFDASDSMALASAFKSIAGQLQTLRLTK